MIKPVLICISISSLSFLAQAQVLCSDIIRSPLQLIQEFRPGPKNDPFLTFRANAGHFWLWLKGHKHSLLEPQGVVAGDPHILNFDDVLLRNGKRDLVLTDFDDGALHAPLIGDFIRLAISNRLSPYRMPVASLMRAYLAGLSGRGTKVPSALEDARESEFRESSKLVKKYVDKNSSGNKLKLKSDMVRFKDLSPFHARMYAESAPTFERYLKDYQFQIIDFAFRVKATGGSQNLPRFIYLVEKDNERSIVEFKLCVEPAADIFQHNGDRNWALRFQELMRLYGRTDIAPVFDWIQAGGNQFHVRERQPALLEFNPDKIDAAKNRKAGKQIYHYIAWIIGRAHHQQGAGASLLTMLQNEKNRNRSEAWVQSYIEELMQLNQTYHGAE